MLRFNQFKNTYPVALRHRFIPVIFVTVFIITAGLAPQSAGAATPTCQRMERQLAAFDSGSRRSMGTRYQTAIKQQKRQISTVQRKIRSAGCKSRQTARASCGELNSTLRKMTINLQSLEKIGKNLSTRSTSSTKNRSRIKRDMRRARCGEKKKIIASVKTNEPKRRLVDSRSRNTSRKHPKSNRDQSTRHNILQKVFGSSSIRQRQQLAALDHRKLKRIRYNRQDRKIWSTRRNLKNYGTVRTFCVRQCDGYYFPVSFSTDHFGIERDAAACSKLCPGVKMELYFHRTSTETAEHMASSVDGTLYASLENAYAYQQEYNPDCACDFSRLDRRNAIDIPASASNDGIAERHSRVIPVPMPTLRKDDVEQQEPATDMDAKPGNAPQTRQNRKIRVIGDAFFPTQ
jgi:hypothetical protein